MPVAWRRIARLFCVRADSAMPAAGFVRSEIERFAEERLGFLGLAPILQQLGQPVQACHELGGIVGPSANRQGLAKQRLGLIRFPPHERSWANPSRLSASSGSDSSRNRRRASSALRMLDSAAA